MTWAKHASAFRGRQMIACAAFTLAPLGLFSLGSTLSLAHEPADPEAYAPGVTYRSVLDGYESIDIVKKPIDWRAANDLAEELDGPRGQLLEPGAKPERKKKP